MPFHPLKQWVLGPYLIYANHSFSARRAYEELKNHGSQLERSGTLNLHSGETVKWINLALRP